MPYPDEITEREASLGFIRAYVNNPAAENFGEESFVAAVILRLGTGHRIIKLVDAPGRVEYAHEAFGTYGTTGRPGWLPILYPYASAEAAIGAAADGAYQINDLAQLVRVHADRFSISLRCPDCAHEFQANSDHLPIGEATICPACGVSRQVEGFNKLNV